MPGGVLEPTEWDAALLDSGIAEARLPSKIVDLRPNFGHVSLSLGLKRGPVLFSFIEGHGGGVTSQIAVKMSLDAIVERAMRLQAEIEAAGGALSATEIVQAGLKEANRRVYEYGSKMLSGAKITATGIAASFDGDKFSIGRTGDFECFLWRRGQMVRFFEKTAAQVSAGEALERLIGANKQLLVDLATVRVQPGDSIIVTTFGAPDAAARMIAKEMQFETNGDTICHAVVSEAVRLFAGKSYGVECPFERNVLAAAFLIEEPPIVLDLEDVIVE